MRPIFADFIRLFYGEKYEDNPELKNQPNIKGINSNIYFIDHLKKFFKFINHLMAFKILF